MALCHYTGAGARKALALNVKMEIDMPKKNDWLCVINTSFGGSSYARGSNMENEISRVLKIFKSDWKHLFKLEKGLKVKVVVVNVTNHESVAWNHQGFYDTKSNEKIDIEKVVERALP